MKYFQHDTSALSNRKIRKIVRTHGCTGYAIWWALLEELYSAEDSGFQIKADDLWLETLAEKLCLADYKALLRVIETMASVGLVNSQMWAESILYVDAIAERGDTYIRQKAQAAERKRRERTLKKSKRVTEESRVTDCENGNVTPSDTDPDSNADSNADTDLKKQTQERSGSGAREDSTPVRCEIVPEIDPVSDRPSVPKVENSPTVKNQDWEEDCYSAPQKFEAKSQFVHSTVKSDRLFEALPGWKVSRKPLDFVQEFVDYLWQFHLPTVPSFQGKPITRDKALTWLSRADFEEERYLNAVIQWQCFEEWKTTGGLPVAQDFSGQQKKASNYVQALNAATNVINGGSLW